MNKAQIEETVYRQKDQIKILEKDVKKLKLLLAIIMEAIKPQLEEALDKTQEDTH